jgi:uncharacterized membrane protein YciS (DUF1049 family)
VIRAALIVVVVAVVLVVASENRTVPVSPEVIFGFRTPEFSLGLLILLSFAAGAAAIGLWVIPAWVRASLSARRQRRQIEELEGRVAAGRMPAAGDAPPHDIV